jgi:uncharacterized protein (TIGR04255 family)
VTDQVMGLGTWKNAPLALVVAQLRYEAIQEELAPLAQRFMTSHSALFSGMHPLQGISLRLGESGPMSVPTMKVNGFDLRNNDGRRCLRLQDGVLTYHTSIYAGSMAFNNEFAELLAVLELAAGQQLRPVRLGLRYVDYICPVVLGEEPESVFVPGFVASPPLAGDEEAPVRMAIFEYQRDQDNGRLRIQYARGFGEPGLPVDLGEAASAPRELMVRYLGGLSGTLDTDRWRMMDGQPIGAGDLKVAFKAMQDDIRNAFHAITTPEARRLWGEGQEKS